MIMKLLVPILAGRGKVVCGLGLTPRPAGSHAVNDQSVNTDDLHHRGQEGSVGATEVRYRGLRKCHHNVAQHGE